MSTQIFLYDRSFYLIVSRINRSHEGNEKKFTDRKRVGFPVIIFPCITKSNNPR